MGRCWFFTLPFVLALFFGFRNLREQAEKKKTTHLIPSAHTTSVR
jgi:hypothetical protein